jgi:hypothetical protein
LVAGPSIDGSSAGKTWFADIKMEKLKSPIEQLFIYENEEKKLHFTEKPNEDLFRRIDNYNRDKSTLTFKVNIDEPSFITMAESYNVEWVAYTNEQDLPHWRANGWANGFFISEPGEYNIKIKFRPQDARDLMINMWLVVWTATLTTCVAYLTYNYKLSEASEQLFKRLRNACARSKT